MVMESSDTTITVPIHSTRKEIFKSVLDFIYTVREPEIREEGIAIEILVAADFYGCVGLKLFAESVLVDRFLKAENAARLLILANSQSCALLKEAAIDLYIREGDIVERTPDWPRVEESAKLLMELLRVARLEKKKPGGDDLKGKIQGMTVAGLRQNLHRLDRRVDGSREILERRLETFINDDYIRWAKNSKSNRQRQLP